MQYSPGQLKAERAPRVGGRIPVAKGFLSSIQGAVAIEFAMVATPLIALLLVSLQTGIIFLADQSLQTATQNSARQLMTGSAQLAGGTQAQFQSSVCNNVPSFFDCSKLMVDVQSSTSYTAVNTSSPIITYDGSGAVTNTWSYSPGNAGDIVIVRVMYNWPVFGGPLAVGLANQPNGAALLVATVVLKNEPFS